MNPALLNRDTMDALSKLNQSNAALRLVLDVSDDRALNDALDAVLTADHAVAEELRRRAQTLHEEMRADEEERR